jgi:hypothetical protein
MKLSDCRKIMIATQRPERQGDTPEVAPSSCCISIVNMPREGTIKDENVTLSEAKGLVLQAEILRFAQNDKAEGYFQSGS